MLVETIGYVCQIVAAALALSLILMILGISVWMAISDRGSAVWGFATICLAAIFYAFIVTYIDATATTMSHGANIATSLLGGAFGVLWLFFIFKPELRKIRRRTSN